MALSIIESRAISKRIKTNLSTLNNGGVSIIESRKLSKAIKEDLALLNGTQAPAPDQNIIFLQEVITGQHDSENVNDLAQNPDLETFTAEDLIPDGLDELSSADYLRQMASKAPTRQSFFNLVVMKVNGASKEDRQQIQELFGLEHPPKGLAELRAASDKFYDSQKGQRKQRRENYKAALAQSKQRRNELFLADITDTARDSSAAMNAHIDSVDKFYRDKGISPDLPFEMAAKQYDYAGWKKSQEPDTQGKATTPKITPTSIESKISVRFNNAKVKDVYIDDEFGNVTATVNGHANTDCGFIEDYTNDANQKQSPKITPTGKTNEVKTAKGTKIDTQFAVVEAADLTTSHDASGNANPAYPSELQPRNRGRDTSQAQIARIAKNLDPDMLGRTRNASNGAPIVGNDGVVESGNGRTMAINQAYQTGNAGDYRDWLENEAADSYGLDAKQIKGMKNPVLVRVRTSDIDRAQFAREANQSDMLAMTSTEKAKADANHLTDAVISKLSADGDLSSANNRDFVLAFMSKLGDDESAGLSTTDGKPTKQLYDRAQAAIFAKAYNDDRLLELMADDAKPDIANIIKSLNQAAPSFIKARSLSEQHTQDVTGAVTDAVSLDKQAVEAIVKATAALKKAKDSNMPIDKLIAQLDMFGDINPVVAEMALFIKDNNKSASRMGEAFTAMADYLVKTLTGQKNSGVFDDEAPINLLDVIKAANTQLQARYGDKVKAIGSGFGGGFIDIFTETRGQKADREAYLAEQAPQTETDPNVALLQDIAKGQYSHLDSEALLDKAEPAARAVDIASYSELVGEAMGEWLNVDNKAYALDSVLDTRNIIGWFEN